MKGLTAGAFRGHRYEDGGRIRPVMHRGSIVEIIVPYGDPRAPFHKKCAFDVVDYGLGASCTSLDLGCDCLGYIHYFDGMLIGKDGAPRHPLNLPRVQIFGLAPYGLVIFISLE